MRERTSLLRRLILITTALVLLWSPSKAQIASSAHTVTLQVNEITLIAVNVGAVNLTINGSTAVAGENVMVATDETSSLLWGTNASARKVTVNTSLAAPLFTLRAVAVSPSTGTAAPEAVLSTVSSDFILGIGRSSGTARIRYIFEALASQGIGTDTHVITFTVVAQ
jgi:hypothetical protein